MHGGKPMRIKDGTGQTPAAIYVKNFILNKDIKSTTISPVSLIIKNNAGDSLTACLPNWLTDGWMDGRTDTKSTTILPVSSIIRNKAGDSPTDWLTDWPTDWPSKRETYENKRWHWWDICCHLCEKKLHTRQGHKVYNDLTRFFDYKKQCW